MPAPTTRQPTDLTPFGERLIEILQGSGDWMTRKQIAAELGRPDSLLTPDDWRVLRELATDSRIDMSWRKIGAVKHEYIYKAK
jgi:hypothetical protein